MNAITDKATIYDLTIGVFEDGGITLEQTTGCGESHYISLHHSQIRYLAERAGLIPAIDLQARIMELEAALRMLSAAAEADSPPWLRAAIASVMESVGLYSNDGGLEQ